MLEIMHLIRCYLLGLCDFVSTLYPCYSIKTLGGLFILSWPLAGYFLDGQGSEVVEDIATVSQSWDPVFKGKEMKAGKADNQAFCQCG